METMQTTGEFEEAALQGRLAFLNQGTTWPRIEVYDNSATPILLVVVPLKKPCGEVTSEHRLSLFASEEAQVVATGTASYANIYNGNGVLAAMNCPITNLGGGGVFEVESVAFFAGAFVKLAGATFW